MQLQFLFVDQMKERKNRNISLNVQNEIFMNIDWT